LFEEAKKEPDPIAMYEVVEELYDTPMPPDILKFLPRDIMNDIVYRVFLLPFLGFLMAASLMDLKNEG
jgi:hypothetical protein